MADAVGTERLDSHIALPRHLFFSIDLVPFCKCDHDPDVSNCAREGATTRTPDPRHAVLVGGRDALRQPINMYCCALWAIRAWAKLGDRLTAAEVALDAGAVRL
jgi:hypothetical protein